MKTEISERLYERAKKIMPGGVNSPVRACRNVGRVPLFIERAKGSKIYDEDGNEYIDYICSWGPNILGNAVDEVVCAAAEACRRGMTFGACHKGETELAERIKRNMPSMEMIRLVNSGTEAAMSAVRVARGYTGKNMIIKFEGCYHGHSDGLLAKAGSGVLTNAIPDSAGVPDGYTKYTLLARYNDKESVEKLFEKFGKDIACVIIEPCAANMGVVKPEDGFLQFLRDITREKDSILIFDEVITGFRLGLNGAQGKYGVIPDMTVLGKIIGGGMPLAAYGGRRDIMECIAPIGNVYQAGTLSGNPAAVAAGNAAIKILEENADIYEKIDKKGERIEKVLREKGFNVNREGSLMTVFFSEKTVHNYDDAKCCDTEKYARFYGYMLERGIYTAPSQYEAMFISAAHSEEDIEYTCDMIAKY